MNISDSDLFRDFARPTLRNLETPSRPWSIWTFARFAMDTVIQYLMSFSRQNVSLVKIEDATEDSYVISIKTRVTGTGPISSTVSAMEVDLTFNGTSFSKMNLPELQTSWGGMDIEVRNQRIKITEMATYMDYVRSMMLGEETAFRLEKETCTISALGLSTNCAYALDVPIRGMQGLRSEIKEMKREDGCVLEVTVTFHNPSPVEIDHGTSIFELRNESGQAIVRLKGLFKIVRGVFDVVLEGKQAAGVEMTESVKLVGIGVEGNSWCNQTLPMIQQTMVLRPEFKGLLTH